MLIDCGLPPSHDRIQRWVDGQFGEGTRPARGPMDITPHVWVLPEDGKIPGFPDWRWIHTPGHTPGHLSLFRESDRTLIVGDAFATAKQESFLAIASQRPEPHGPPAYFTTGRDAARDSVRKPAA